MAVQRYKSLHIDTYGDYDKIRVTERALSGLAESSVRIKVYAAALNKADLHLFLGRPNIIKLAYGRKKPKIEYPGSDIVGEVVETGIAVKDFKAGDMVFGDLSGVGFGAYAEYADVPAQAVYQVPENLTPEQAACLPMPASTALIAIDKTDVRPGQNVLVYGASGSVGSFVVQILQTMKVNITAVASQAHRGDLHSAGITDILDYKSEDFTLAENTYDRIIAVNGYQPLKKYLKALKKKGTLTVVGGDFKQTLAAIIKGPFAGIFKGKKVQTMLAKTTAKHLEAIKQLAENNLIKPKIGKVYTLDQAKTAYRDFYEGKYSGKLIFRINNQTKSE